MKLQSIYEHMEKGALLVPSGANCKIVFRHSIRGKIESGIGREVMLTNEGIELARSFGRNLNYDIGVIASSSCDRNIQTCNEILKGKKVQKSIIIASKELEGPQTKDEKVCGMFFEKMNFRSDIIIHKLVTEGIPGFNTIEDAAKIMLDYIFANGNAENSVDLFCTHDFQMAILYAYLFGFKSSEEELKYTKWPMMLEGMICWGTRNHFWCSWRDQIKEFINKSSHE